jgi:hypothetical protein
VQCVTHVMGAAYFLEFLLTGCLCALHGAWLYSGYRAVLTGGIGATLAASPPANHLLEARVGGPGGLAIPIALPAAYLTFVYFAHWLLPLFFKSKEAFPKLAGAMDAYNVYSAALSAAMLCLLAREFVGVGVASGNPFTLRYSEKQHGSAWAAALWLNYQSKFVEYADTAFILFKGNADKQLSHLHVIHHAEMGPLMYLFCSVTAGGQSAFGPMINSLVHLL